MEKKKTRGREEKTEAVNFEKALKELETIAENLEEGELSLDESIRQFEKGMQLARLCRRKLDEAERKIEILQKGESGRVEVKRVDVRDDTGEITDDDDLQGSLL